MFEIVEGVKDSVPMSAQIRGWAHAVKKQRIIALVFVQIVLVFRGVNGNVRSAASIQLREKQTEPVGMFVKDSEGCVVHLVHLLFDARRRRERATKNPQRRAVRVFGV